MLKRKKRRSREFKDSSRVIDMAEAREARKRRREDATEKKSKSKKVKPANTERTTHKSKKGKAFYAVIFLVIITVIGMSAYNMITLKMQEADLKAEQAQLMKKKERLEYDLSQMNSAEYVEQQARQMLKMIKPGEILYILPDHTTQSTSSGIVPSE